MNRRSFPLFVPLFLITATSVDAEPPQSELGAKMSLAFLLAELCTPTIFLYQPRYVVSGRRETWIDIGEVSINYILLVILAGSPEFSANELVRLFA